MNEKSTVVEMTRRRNDRLLQFLSLQPFERISCKQIPDKPGIANTPVFYNNFHNTACFPPNTRENFC